MSCMTTRRNFLLGACALAGVAALPRRSAAQPAASPQFTLTAKERPFTLPGCSGPSAFWTYAEGWPLVLRVPRGKELTVRLDNQLREHTAIHWHGLRIPFDQDGVPHITQPPIEPGHSFTYRFTPPDPGTFFFHPHCNTAEALGRGLAAVLIVEDPREAGLFDVDEVLALKDWRVRPDGSFDSFTTDKGAGRAGTFGSLRTVNGTTPPTLTVAPGAVVRLRVMNVDVTRIAHLDLRGAKSAIIATDGNACPPMAVEGWRLGPAMRADIAFIAPAEEGREVALYDTRGQEDWLMANLVTTGAPLKRGKRIPALPPAELPTPALARATRIPLTLQAGLEDAAMAAWAKESGFTLDQVCASSKIFWSMNKTSWPGMSPNKVPPPLAELKSGASYVMEVFNSTPHAHPVHLHGHTFRVLSSSERKVAPHWADTVLLAPKERVEIAFVAATPGDWMVHCHIIEHQETGMMGYLRVA